MGNLNRRVLTLDYEEHYHGSTYIFVVVTVLENVRLSCSLLTRICDFQYEIMMGSF